MRTALARNVRILGIVAACVVVGATTVLPQDAKKSGPAPEPAKVEPIVSQLVDAHNKERAKAGLPPLKLESHLTDAAKVHARDMAEHEFMSHDGSDGSHPAERVTRAGYPYLKTGENVAKGYRSVAEVMQVWIDSPPHKKNILGADYTEIGVAVVYGEDGKPYWAAEFGKPIPKFDATTAAGDLVKEINDERVYAKFAPLTIDPKLAKPAQEQAEKLAKAKSKGGATATFDGIDEKLFQDLAVSTAAGHPDAQSMVDALMAKPDLKAQILGKYARIGTGYAISEEGIPYWCLILANPARRR